MQKCRRCKAELKKDEKRDCLYCPVCHPPQTGPVVTEERLPNTRIDVPWTEERILEIIDKHVPDMIRGMLENWHIQKPLVTKDEIETTVGGGAANVNTTIQPPETWRETAKRLGIPVYDKENSRPRLKVDVLKDIEEKIKVPA